SGWKLERHSVPTILSIHNLSDEGRCQPWPLHMERACDACKRMDRYTFSLLSARNTCATRSSFNCHERGGLGDFAASSLGFRKIWMRYELPMTTRRPWFKSIQPGSDC